MRILKVIHGYPMRYNAGSEVYSQTLCHGLAARNEVHVFTREEDVFAPDYALRRESDEMDTRVALHLVNMPRSRDRYRHEGVDRRFGEVLAAVRPDVVHVGHLNHLSTSLVTVAARAEIPVVFTLHDYWIMCPRGQFMQMHPEDPDDLWAACEGQEDRRCAERCYARYFSGAPEQNGADVVHWTDWVARRMRHVRETCEQVDLFIAPSRYLLERYRGAFGLSEHKLVFLDYGFDRRRLEHRERVPGEPFTFGYIGTHIPAKGIHHLIDAFSRVRAGARLRIWGRPRGQDTDSLKSLARTLLGERCDAVEWLPEYRNQEIVREVFNRVDAIVVPSVWVENSPLVIHEAQQARVPVITADAGGMAEYVHHEVNGLLFEHRNPCSLSEQMQRLADDPELARRLGTRGYLHSPDGNIPDDDSHVRDIEELYARCVARRDASAVARSKGPWRITFDTNPDDCNLRCLMCEERSPFRERAKNERRRMPFDMIRKTVEEAVKLGLREIIPSTMGEPLLYEQFDDVVDLCAAHGLKLNLTTNGTFPHRGARAWAERIVPVASDVKISWNGATAKTYETIMTGARWEEALANVRAFIAVRDDYARTGGNRCRVTFQLTFLETNVSELADVVRLAISLGVDRVKGHHVWTHFDELKPLSMRRDPDAIRRWNLSVAEARTVAAELRLPNGERILLDNVVPLDEGAVTNLAPGGSCPFLGQEAWVSAEGRFDPCCAPDELRRTLGSFGDLAQDSLCAIWNGEPYRHLLATYRNRDLCVRCNMRRKKEGV